MQVTVVDRNGSMGEAIYRTVVSEEIKRIKAKHAEEIADLTMAHRITEGNLGRMRSRDLRHRLECTRFTRCEAIRNRIAAVWGAIWGLLLEFGLIIDENE